MSPTVPLSRVNEDIVELHAHREGQQAMTTADAVNPLKAEIDWEAIEGMYRAGLLSVREIARSHGVSHVAILKRAKADEVMFGDATWHRERIARLMGA